MESDITNTKQVIVIRKDLNMRKGKACAQASHASMSFLTKDNNVERRWAFAGGGLGIEVQYTAMDFEWNDHFTKEVRDWLSSSFRKIVCYVDSEQELDELHQKCLDHDLVSHMIIDNGATEFDGIKTKTCIAIGPHYDHKFEGLTDHLPLY